VLLATRSPAATEYGVAQVRRRLESPALRVLHVILAPAAARALLLGFVRLENRGDEPLALEYTETWDVAAGEYRAASTACERRFGGHVFALADASTASNAHPHEPPPARGLALELQVGLPARSAATWRSPTSPCPTTRTPARWSRLARRGGGGAGSNRRVGSLRRSLPRPRPIHSIVMKRLLALAPALLLLAAAGGASAGNSTQIQAETTRNLEGGAGRIATFWWLPREYWEACALELGLPDAERAKIRAMFRDYIIVGVVDAKVSVENKQAELKSTPEIVARAKFYRNGEPVEVLREVTPELQALVYPLSAFMRASLRGLGDGLRLLPLPNADAKGEPILEGASRGELRVEYRFEENDTAQAAYWHAPFTAVAGTRTCPKGGEPLEASFEYCPWHGVKAGAAKR
jgi:hypothetical protein